MSQPISACTISKAAHGNQDALKFLTQAMKTNVECGHYSTFPCRHDPPCPVPTEEMMKKLNQHLHETAEREGWKRGAQGRKGTGGFYHAA